MTTRRTKPAGAYVGKEDAFQVSAMTLLRAIAKECFLDYRQIMHIPNGGKRNAIVAAKLKRQGVVPGYPDIMIFEPEQWRHVVAKRTNYSDRLCGLALELKVWPHKPTKEQEAVHELLRLSGWRVVVCYGLGEVEAEALRYFDVG